MSCQYGIPYTTDKPKNTLGCDHEELRHHIPVAKLDDLRKMRDAYYTDHSKARKAIDAITSNKRIKNKHIDFKTLASLHKSWFNFRSLDYYLYRLGYTPHCSATYNADVQEVLSRLASDTTSSLMLYGEYHGFQNIYWYWGGGFDKWREASQPDFPAKEDYFKEHLGILYF